MRYALCLLWGLVGGFGCRFDWPPECEVKQDCPDGLVCDSSGYCVRGGGTCNTTPDCPIGYFCDFDGFCAPDNNQDFNCATTAQTFPSSFVCDGTFHCDDQSDELGCGPCGPNQFWCESGTPMCINASDACDGIIQCQSGLDEISGCQGCNVDQFSCSTSGPCIGANLTCDGTVHCTATGNDEAPNSPGCN